MPTLTVRQFVHQAYRLISPSNPTVPLQDDDLQLGILILNQLMNDYASSGLMMTIAQTVNLPVNLGTFTVVAGPPMFVPTPDITLGRIANIEDAWLLLDGVTYPLIQESRDNYLASWKYDPLQGLPRFIIVFQDVETTTIRLYPAPSQFFEFYLRAKFQLPDFTANDTMAALPLYYTRYLLFALAKDISLYKGRAEAWTERLEMAYREAKDAMEGASEVNLSITGDRASLLNGAWRVRSGL